MKTIAPREVELSATEMLARDRFNEYLSPPFNFGIAKAAVRALNEMRTGTMLGPASCPPSEGRAPAEFPSDEFISWLSEDTCHSYRDTYIVVRPQWRTTTQLKTSGSVNRTGA